MFENVLLAPPDPIFGLKDAFQRDRNPNKIYLGAGVYKDERGRTPVLASVKEAERRILEHEPSKEYLPIDGMLEYRKSVEELIFGRKHEIIESQRVATAQTPGGTGALRVAGDFLRSIRPSTTIWLSDPTWVNHSQIYTAAGLQIKSYRYFRRQDNELDFEGMLAGITSMNAGDVILLQGCCHNPTGLDPRPEQWERIGEALAEHRVLPLVDIAYQGFAFGVREDSMPTRLLCHNVPELIICVSFSKNFGLYNERVGALMVVAKSDGIAKSISSQIKRTIRSNYSNPPAHGAAIVSTILSDASLRQQWEDELSQMRQRIHHMRRLFVDGLDKRGVELYSSGNSSISRQRGMFSFSGLTVNQVSILRDQFSIYIVESGRINVACLNEVNVEQLCNAIAAVSEPRKSRVLLA